MPHLAAFDKSIKNLNAHLWLLLTLAEHTKEMFTAMPGLNGLKHEKVLPSLFFLAPTYSPRLRTRNKTLSTDMQELAGSVEHWIPAYFLVLAKSIGECIAKDIIEDKYNKDMAVKAAIDAMINSKRGNKKTKLKVIEDVAQKITRGDFKNARTVVDINARLQNAPTIGNLLKTRAKTRNDMAHDLGEQYKGKAPVNVTDLNEYIQALQSVIHAM